MKKILPKSCCSVKCQGILSWTHGSHCKKTSFSPFNSFLLLTRVTCRQKNQWPNSHLGFRLEAAGYWKFLIMSENYFPNGNTNTTPPTWPADNWTQPMFKNIQQLSRHSKSEFHPTKSVKTWKRIPNVNTVHLPMVKKISSHILLVLSTYRL